MNLIVDRILQCMMKTTDLDDEYDGGNAAIRGASKRNEARSARIVGFRRHFLSFGLYSRNMNDL